MTSRSLFFNLMKQDMKQRLWVPILSLVVFIITMPLFITFKIQTTLVKYAGRYYAYEPVTSMSKYGKEAAAADILGYFYGIDFILVVCIVGALICGISGFAYLHNKSKVDMYHSIPVKRTTLFAVKFVNGFLFYAVPYLLCMLISMLIGFGYGIVNWKTLAYGFAGFGINTLIFMSFYIVAIMATMLTGNIIIALLGFGTITGYVPGIIGLVSLYANQYLQSLSDQILQSRLVDLLLYLSPAGLTYKLGSTFFTNYLDIAPAAIKARVILAVVTIVLCALGTACCVFLYLARASEKAGNAMAFRITETIVRIAVVIPASLLFAIFVLSFGLKGLTDTAVVVWFVVAIAIGAVLIHGFMETIYNRDVKKALRHWGQLLISIAAAALFFVGFYFDIFKLESYIPKFEDVDYISMDGNNHGIYGDYVTEDLDFISKRQYADLYMKLTGKESYEAAQYMKDTYLACRKTVNGEGYQYAWEDDKDGSYYCYDDHGNVITGSRTEYYSVDFHLKNGSVIKRRYYLINSDELLAELKKINTCDEFIEAAYPLKAYIDRGFVLVEGLVNCYEYDKDQAWRDTQYWDYKLNNPKEFIDVYLSELPDAEDRVFSSCDYFIRLAYSTEDYAKKNEDTVAHFYRNGDEEFYPSVTFEVEVYEGMEKTIEYIKNNSYAIDADYQEYNNTRWEYTDAVYEDTLIW